MKTIGLIGGMSWESTAEYYRILNETVRDRLGGLHSARIVMVSVDFAEIEAMQLEARWDDAGEALAAAARQLEAAGAECVLICTNTMHRVADVVQASVSIPLLHLADTTAALIVRQLPALHTVGLLGTAFTMEQAFYRERLEDAGFTVLIPNDDDRQVIHRVIYDELCLGVVREESRAAYYRVMDALVDAGAECIILGCTEIELLVDPDQSWRVPLFPTSRIHAQAAVEWALEESE
ncbi:MAG: aspartate/glutamate racemase family protein [Thermomicrobiales bacterium]|nr:aspartate/glutamate racemase family protein [Thermomicrobiales bacterium]MCO5218129.1 aspartate/glutamate racemase family protein [Thermomicrobiales bacterium]MCO5225552.1 aspartate/glutamate racemase family protein [Thermomicrobiales bacterium]MCO5227244.1 aspartate/glutamate racemase family protein [Thermomicrobiales bacterium]